MEVFVNKIAKYFSANKKASGKKLPDALIFY